MNKGYFLLFVLIFLAGTGLTAGNKKNRPAGPAEQRLSEADQRRFDYFFYEGVRLKNNEKYDEALEAFRFCLTLDSLNAGALAETGALLIPAGLTDEAISCFEKALKETPDNWWYSLQLISLYSATKQWDKGIASAIRLQKMYPAKEEVYQMLAAFYKEKKEYSKAIAAYDKLESIAGIDQSLSFEKFRLYLMSNKTKKGIAEIDKLVNKFPGESRYKVLRGDIFMEQKMPEKAFEVYQQVLKDDPQNGLVYVSLSEYYNTVNQPEKALESIVTALKNEQLDVETKVQVLGQYVEKLVKDSTKFSETESLFKLLVDRYPLEEQVHNYYALFLQYQKRNAEAVSELETVVNINTKNDQAWLQLIQFYLQQENVDQVLLTADRAIKNNSGNAAFYFYKSIALFQKKDYKGVIPVCQTGLSHIVEGQTAIKSDFYSQIADAYFKLELKDSAFVNYDRAIEVNPANLMVLNNYAYYLSLEKLNLRKAERMSAKTVEAEPQNSTYLDTYAWILYEQGSYSLAKLYIEKALKNRTKGEDDGVLLEHYGDILWMNKEDAKALETWQKSFDSGNKTEELKKKIENKGWKRDQK